MPIAQYFCPPLSSLTRRHFLAASSVIGLGLTLPARLARAAAIDSGHVKDGKVVLPSIDADTEPKGEGPRNPFPLEKRVGFAIVGLGRLAVEEIIPAFAASKYARITALVSGTPDKLALIGDQYGVPSEHRYSYDDFDKIKNDASIDVVYIVLPNSLHKEFTLRAAQAGKHVLCEKPMATSSEDARAMIDACAKADRKLMIAYRMQYEPHMREIIRLVRKNALGKVRVIDTFNVQNQGAPSQWRLDKELAGGGSLPDIGLYCLNSVRAILGEEPIEVSARIETPNGDARFKQVEDTISFTLRFPSGALANCLSSYSAYKQRRLSVLGETGCIEMQRAYDYQGQQMTRLQADGKNETETQIVLPAKDQFALELDHMAQCVRENHVPRTPGEEGLQDQILMEAIYQAANSGQPVAMPLITKRDSTRGPAFEEGMN